MKRAKKMTPMITGSDTMNDGYGKETNAWDEISKLWQQTQQRFPFLTRFAIARYDASTDELRTQELDPDSQGTLAGYAAYLKECRSLLQAAHSSKPRIINDFEIFRNCNRLHAKQLYRKGYRASLTLPMSSSGNLEGFLFFNASQSHVFTPMNISLLEQVAEEFTTLVRQMTQPSQGLQTSANSILSNLLPQTPPDTAHQERIKRLSRLIAMYLAKEGVLNSDRVELIGECSVLRKLGAILFDKSGWDTTRTGEVTARELTQLESLWRDYQSKHLSESKVLHNMLSDHQTLSSASPIAKSLPLESRIVAVSELFDAMTTQREPSAMSNQQALNYMSKYPSRYDSTCVQALACHQDQVHRIQAAFA